MFVIKDSNGLGNIDKELEPEALDFNEVTFRGMGISGTIWNGLRLQQWRAGNFQENKNLWLKGNYQTTQQI